MHGPLALGARGIHYLADGRVDGEDPLASFSPRAAEHLRRTDRFPHVPDILVNSFYDPVLDEGCAFEELISFHGGLGGPQTEAFILHPATLRVPDGPIVGAAAVHALLLGWRQSLQGGGARRGGARRRGRDVSDTVVFIPAWNEEENLPAVLDDLRAELPDVDVVVVDDGSTDRTADVAREHGAEVLSLGTNRGLPVGIAAGYAYALEHGYAFCGRVDADGQHPAPELTRLLAMVRDDRCDVAVGSRFVSGDGYEPYRYKPDHVRRFGTATLRRAMASVIGRPFADATSGLYAVNAKALPLLAEPFSTEAPEVEALIRITDAGLRLEEVPVNMAERASGESKLRGKKALKVVLTVVGTLVAAKLIQARRSR